jgi:hypothetical protein
MLTGISHTSTLESTTHFATNGKHHLSKPPYRQEKHRSQSQRGGTLQILTDRWVSRLKDKGMDPYGLGRWSYMILNGRGNKSIAIITAYRPCSDTPSSAGNKTVYMQQFCTLLAYNNSIKSLATPNPHRQFTLDLQAWISKLQSSGHSIILCLDSNEHISLSDGKYEPLEYTEGTFTSSPTHSGKISSLAVTCGLCDFLALLHPPPYPSTYAYSKNRLDYILISQDIASSAIHSGVLPLYSVFHSDHNAVYLDLNSQTLFGDTTHPVAPPHRRGLQLRDPRKIETYITALHKQLSYHNILDKISILDTSLTTNTWTSSHTLEYEKIDKIITDSMIYAERQVTRSVSSTFQWSVELAQAIQACRYWQLRIKQLKGRLVPQSTLDRMRIVSGLPKEVASPQPFPSVLQNLKRARDFVASCQTNHVELRKKYLEGLAEAIILKRCPFLSAPKRNGEKLRKIAHEIRELIKREQRRLMYRRIKTTLQPPSSN